ncbi:MAG: PAS domain S-box protein [Verrucomicrobiota bacterium]
MTPTSSNRWRGLFGGLCAFTVVAWFALFEARAPKEPDDALFEAVHLAAVLVGLYFVTRLELRPLELGWSVFTYGLLIDFLDEFTSEPDWINTQLQGIIESSGLLLIVSGLYRSYQTLQTNLASLKQANDALRESEEKYQLLFSKEMDAVILSDAQTHRILDVNESAVRIYGYTRDEFLSTTILHISAEPDQTTIRVKESIRSAAVRTPLHWHRKKDGSMFPVEILSGAYLWRGRQVMCSIIRDITERQRAEEALRKSEHEFRRVWENSQDGMRITDAEGGIVMVNDAYCRMAGHSREELVGRPFAMIYTDSSANLRVAKYRERFTARSFEPHFQREVTLRDGRRIWFEITNTYLDVEGEPPRLLSIFRDITDRKRAEAERLGIERKLQESRKFESIGVLAGGVAHDFNNLLTGILGYANLARQELPSTAQAHAYLGHIEKASLQAAGLCAQLLAYSGKGRFVMQRIDLSAVVRDALDIVEHQSPQSAEFKVELAAHLPPVSADAVQMRQVVINILVNSVEALENKDGAIRVATRTMTVTPEFLATGFRPDDVPPGEYVCLEIQDTGCGMDTSVLTRVFEPFFSTKFAGRGLGLAAVMGIVRGHKGALRVQSRKGAGSTFTLLFPIAEGPIETTAPPTPIEGAWRTSGTILIIDDEEDVRNVAAAIAQTCGLRAVLAGGGEEGVTRFQEMAGEIRLVLLDLAMPGMDGEQTFHELRRVRPDVRVLVVTGYGDQDMLNRLDKHNVLGFVQKPFRADVLRARLREALEFGGVPPV